MTTARCILYNRQGNLPHSKQNSTFILFLAQFLIMHLAQPANTVSDLHPRHFTSSVFPVGKLFLNPSGRSSHTAGFPESKPRLYAIGTSQAPQ
jgi:hypothetical protein